MKAYVVTYDGKYVYDGRYYDGTSFVKLNHAILYSKTEAEDMKAYFESTASRFDDAEYKVVPVEITLVEE